MESDGSGLRGAAAGGRGDVGPAPAGVTQEAADGWALSSEALRRLRLGEGRAEDAFLPPPVRSAPVVTSVGQYSRIRGGVTSFGPLGRVVATGLVVLVLVGAYAWCRNGVLMLLFLPVVVVLLRDIWHPERLAPAIVVEDHGVDPRISAGERPSSGVADVPR